MRKILVIAAVLLVAATIFAMNHDNPGRDCRQGMGNERMGMMNRGQQGNHGDMMMGIMHQLELTDAQEAQMKSQRVKIEKSAIDINAQIKSLEIDARVAMDEMNFSQMKKVSNSIFDLKKELKNLRIDNQEKCWNILTAEQKAQAMELRKQPKGMQRRMKDCDDDEKTGIQRHERLREHQDDDD
ncbi:MAG: Spy/CpxP family protein refolding chaperone [Candidatus Cloacimonetes bacterium]|nr:Spy/CpxP family protein refolding chaperone [Candidatus Cloacimonadota bacterium]